MNIWIWVFEVRGMVYRIMTEKYQWVTLTHICFIIQELLFYKLKMVDLEREREREMKTEK